MRTRILSLAVIALMGGTIMTGCGAASKRDVTSAKQNIKKADKDLKHARTAAHEEIKTDVEADWAKFKDKSDTAFEERAILIDEFEGALSQVGQQRIQEMNLQLAKLKRKNDALKNRLAQRNDSFKEKRIRFNASAKEKEQKFEAEFNHDMHELGTALKDLFKNNVQ
ncbi:hypothetical protein [Maribacter sp. 2307ULW6-5]|uniref:hypothetical protein n=1 Tax=Maribacter sp. 2307ULW6-5 TaxID=3386275 RepID=UPI0039BC2348